MHGDTERCNIPVPSGACSTPAVCKPSTPLVGRVRVPGLQAAANDIADDDQFRDRPQRHRHLRRQNSEPTLPVRHVGPYVAMPKYWSSPNAVIAFPRMSL